MTVRGPTLKTTIVNASRNSVISAAEADRILKAIGTSLSNLEARQLGDLWSRSVNNYESGGGRAPMASPATPRMNQGAVARFNAFFVARDLPYGENRDKMVADISATLRDAPRPWPELRAAPRQRNLQEVLVRDQRPVDGFKEDALVDVVKKQFFMRLTGGGRGGPSESFFGPFPLQREVPASIVDRLLRKFDHEVSVDRVTWTHSSILPADQPMRRILLRREPGFDTYTYTALIPQGVDPEKAKKFYVERTGGIAGLVRYAGPIIVNGRDV